MAQENRKGSLGVTELGRLINASKGQIQGATLQFPTIGYHTVEESTTPTTIDSMVQVLTELYINEERRAAGV